MSKTVELSRVSNVAEGSTFTIECPTNGLTYKRIILEMGGTVFQEDDILNLEVQVNGKAIQSFATGTQLRQINDFYGRPDNTANGMLELYFDQPELMEAFRTLPGLGTMDVDTLTIVGDLSGTTAPTLKAHAVLDAPSPMGTIIKIKRFPVTFSAAGIQEIDKLPMGPHIKAIHLFKADVNDAEVEINGVKVYDASKTLGETEQGIWGRVPVTAACTHIDFCLDGDLRQSIVTRGLDDFRIRMDLGTTGQVVALVEYLDGFQGI